MGGGSQCKKRSLSSSHGVFCFDGVAVSMATSAVPGQPATYKLVVVGDGGVERARSPSRFFQKIFVPDYDPTIEDSYLKHTEIDGQWAILDVLDTAAHPESERQGVVPMVLIANKVDLVHLRKITSDQGKEMAMKHSITYIETSAKDPPMNVDKAFHELVRSDSVSEQQVPERARRRRKQMAADRPSGSARLHCVLL
ncbi:hypothetical protein Q7C36_021264 [Tachysurus vachellii]|uniref:Small monomeric GTPase n=1 Tax=Tachysurus vachellii TaxID=175792 RepID=A0AA88LJJ7_TACVA|nr:hypothetical protein Q7C36_021264 [Tachysurus vachellii]